LPEGAGPTRGPAIQYSGRRPADLSPLPEFPCASPP